MITAERLREVYSYDQDTGLWQNRSTGRVIGSINKVTGYVQMCACGYHSYAHRFAFLYMVGELPVDQVHHKNEVRSDNRWDNLVQATGSQNLSVRSYSEASSGYRGVRLHRGRYQAVISIENKTFPLGTYDTPQEAHLVYMTKAKEVRGEFVRPD